MLGTINKAKGRRITALIEQLEIRQLLSAAIFYVDGYAPWSNQTGTSWANAYTDLQTALINAPSDSIIRVAQGTYNPTTDQDPSASFELRNGVELDGGFAGNGAPVAGDRNVDAYPTILSGDIGAGGSSDVQSNHVVDAPLSTDATAVLDGFIITGGSAGSGYGGGIRIDYASPVINDCTITGNSAAEGGGIFVNGRSYPAISNCNISGNTATGNGGGIENRYDAGATIVDCTISGNSASQAGGGVLNESSYGTTLNDCQIVGNQAGTDGGGIADIDDSPTLVDCAISGNTANGNGGGVDNNYESSPDITDSIISGNIANNGGGIYDNLYSSPTLTNCVIAGNTAYSGGGAIYNWASAPTLTNCTVADNSGGGIDNYLFSSPILVNSILWNDQSHEIQNAPQSLAVATYSDIQNGYAGTGNIDLNPIFVDPSAGEFQLQPESACIDAGNNAPFSNGDTDLAGNPRIFNGAVDIGAYEVQGARVTTLYVDAAAIGAETGFDWTDAFTNLQSALALSTAGVTIDVAQGTYTPTSGSDRTARFNLIDGVSIYGGFGGVASSTPDARNLSATPSILSGDIGTAGDNTDNSYTVVNCYYLGSTAILDGFTITGGNAIDNGGYLSGCGGGVFSDNASPTISNCIITANTAEFGGGIFDLRSALALVDSTISGNIATDSGGGVTNDLSTPTFNDCTIQGNSATNYGGGIDNFFSTAALTNCQIVGNTANNGAGISCRSASSALITNCTIRENIANASGGGMKIDESSPIITGCNFVSNTAGAGGGVANSDSAAPTFTQCIFGRNTASHGGGMFNDSSTPALTNCIFTQNQGTATGGAVVNTSDSPAKIVNCLFLRNTSGAGAAVYNDGSNPSLTNCTLTLNNATSSGGGMLDTSSSPTVTNCIFWNDAAPNGPEIHDDSNSGPAVTYTDVEGGQAGAGNIRSNPLFISDSDQHLQFISPCIDAGNDSSLAHGFTDLSGNPRFFDFPGVDHNGATLFLRCQFASGRLPPKSRTSGYMICGGRAAE